MTAEPRAGRSGAAPADWRASVALSLAALFWSGNVVAGRALRGATDPITLNTLRWGLALAIFLPLVLPACIRHAAAVRRSWLLLLGLGATGLAAFQTTVYAAVAHTTATNAVLVLALAPVAILLASALIGDSRPSAMQWAGSAVSLAGVAVLVTRADPEVVRGLAFNIGDLWLLGAVALWATYSLLLRRRPAELPQAVALAASMGFAVVLMLALLVATARGARFEPSAPVLAALGYIVVFPSLLAFMLLSWGVARIGPERAGQYVNLMPVFGSLLAMAILGERIAPVQVAGALIVFAGIAMVVRAGRR